MKLEYKIRDKIFTLSPKSLGLIGVSLTSIFIGVGVLVDAPIFFPSAFHFLIPENLRAFIWISAGLFGFYAGLVRKYKAVALVFLQIMPLVRFASFTWAWLMWILPGLPDGYKYGWYNAISQLGFVLTVWLLSSMPDYSMLPKRIKKDDLDD